MAKGLAEDLLTLLNKRISEENEKHSRNEIETLSSNKELMHLIGINNKKTLYKYISLCVPPEDREYRAHILRSEAKQKDWERSEFYQIQVFISTKRWKNREYRNMVVEKLNEPEYTNRVSERMSTQWDNEWGDERRIDMNTTRYKKKMSRSKKKSNKIKNRKKILETRKNKTSKNKVLRTKNEPEEDKPLSNRSLAGIKRWKGEFGDYMRTLAKSNGYRTKLSLSWKGKRGDKQRKLMESQEFRDMMSEIKTNVCNTPEYRADRSIISSRIMEDQSVKDKISVSVSALWNDKDFVKRMLESKNYNPNNLEELLISSLTEIGLYAVNRHEAEEGQLYYPGIKGNFWFKTLKDGKSKLPDFKIKGQLKVIELYGSYHHSQEFCENRNRPDYDWIPKKMIEEYAKVGIECKLFWDTEIYEDIKGITKEISEWVGMKSKVLV